MNNIQTTIPQKGGILCLRAKKEKVIHVDKLVIHAKEVEIIDEGRKGNVTSRDPWSFFWGRPRREEFNVTAIEGQEELEKQLTRTGILRKSENY